MNVGGIKVICYGMICDWVVGLKVVIGKGDVLDLNNDLVKNVIGYDFCNLFIGVEGMLGLIVEVIMKLVCSLDNLIVLVLGVFEFDVIMNVLMVFQNCIDLIVFEFFLEKVV